jgi:iron-sulfur cluster assembly protein
MLTLTNNAVEAVKGLVSTSQEIAETGGLRLTAQRDGTQASFKLRVAQVPAEDDQVIESRGARVFVEPDAASLLDDKVLDAAIEQDGVAFMVLDRPDA